MFLALASRVPVNIVFLVLVFLIFEIQILFIWYQFEDMRKSPVEGAFEGTFACEVEATTSITLKILISTRGANLIFGPGNGDRMLIEKSTCYPGRLTYTGC